MEKSILDLSFSIIPANFFRGKSLFVVVYVVAIVF